MADNHTMRKSDKVKPEPYILIDKRASSSKTLLELNNRRIFNLSWPVILVALATLAFLGFVLDSFLNHQLDPKGCEMSYMRPVFLKQNDFNHLHTKYTKKYELYLYREHGYDQTNSPPNGIPVLFIPGNAGSYKQVRSIASGAAELYYDTVAHQEGAAKNGILNLDFFSVDFNEELSALHGHSLLEQAEYVNDAIKYILALYNQRNSYPTYPTAQFPTPKSVLIIGHSMGGVVARTLITLPNYLNDSINTIVTLATPHMASPAPIERVGTNLYARITEYWKSGYTTNVTSSAFENMALISIAGGNHDTIISSDFSDISTIVPPSNGFTVFTTTIPDVWLTMDHQCILWCAEIVRTLAKTLLSVVDAKHPGQTKLISERVFEFRRNLLSGLETDMVQQLIDNTSDSFSAIDLNTTSHEIVPFDERLVLNGRQETPKTYPKFHLYSIPEQSTANFSFSLFTNQKPEKHGFFNLVLCKRIGQKETIDCADVSHIAAPLPGDSNQGANGRVWFLNLEEDMLQSYSYVGISYNREGYWSSNHYLFAEFYNPEENRLDVKFTLSNLLFKKIQVSPFPKRRSLFTTLNIDIEENPLLAYRMSVTPLDNQESSQPALFLPMVRQYSSSPMHESKFWHNISEVNVNYHGPTPFAMMQPSLLEPFVRPAWKGVEFQFWIDPRINTQYKVEFWLDWYGSLGRTARRCDMVLAAFPFLIIIKLFQIQFSFWNKNGVFPTFGHALKLFIWNHLWKIVVLISSLAVVQSIFLPMLQSASILSLENLPINISGILVGDRGSILWLLNPIFLVVAVGTVIVIWLLVTLVIIIIAEVSGFIENRIPGLAGFISRPNESDAKRLRRRVVTTLILFLLVATFVPFQFAYCSAFLVQLFSCVRTMLRAKISNKGKDSSQALWDRYHYQSSMLMLMFTLLPYNIPVLIVWIRNLAAHWFTQAPADHSLFAIAPIMVYVEMTINKMLPRFSERLSNWTRYIVNMIVVVTLIYGVRFPYLVHYITNGFVLWLVGLYLSHSKTVQSLVEKLLGSWINTKKRS
ncbi:GPI inositol deacylase [Basidiobolus ranarum]|uniref:GPI inositol-deacylase n=1 Tax=Basidiobolus ranarum TaxID=34480 RepID=A0ABR2X2M9_9FUNG